MYCEMSDLFCYFLLALGLYTRKSKINPNLSGHFRTTTKNPENLRQYKSKVSLL